MKNVILIIRINAFLQRLFFKDSTMTDKNYSWQGSPNAGVVLSIVAGLGALVVLLAGFAS
jgi:hypothetical protein